MRLSAAGDSHVGLQRERNEDAYLLLDEERLFCVADGMGGHSSGDVAARIAVEELAEFFRITGRDDEATWPFREEQGRTYYENRLVNGIKLANQRIREQAQQDERRGGMGTTLVCAWFHEHQPEALIGHVGDSRAYLLRGVGLSPLTEDHSLLNDLVRANQLTPEQIEGYPHKNVISRALGLRERVEVDVARVPLLDGDTILLCCDGLSGMLSDKRMAEIMRPYRGDPARTVQALIEAANQAGGEDNITCVVVSCRDDGPAQA
jgi:protein phosphatase